MDNIKKLDKIFRKILYILTPRQKRGSIKVFLSMIVCSVLELLGVSSIYPFLQSMTKGEAIKEEWYSKVIYTFLPDISLTGELIVLGLCVVMIFIIKNIVALWCTRVQLKYTYSLQKEMSVTMLDSYMKRPYEFFVNTNTSFIFRGLSGDIGSVYHTIMGFFEIITQIMAAGMIGMYLIITDWFIAVCALGLAGLCLIGTVLGFKDLMKKAGKKARDAVALQGKWSNQAVFGIKEITVLNRRKIFVDKYAETATIVEKANVTSAFVSSCPDRVLEGVCIAGFMCIVCIRIASNVDLSSFIPVMGTFAMGAFKILPSVSKISSRINTIVFYQPGLDNCYDNFKEAEKIDKIKSNRQYINTNSGDAEKERIPFEKELVIDNITWKYEQAEKPVIKGLSMKISKGEAVAFIGPSGAGKTTLADIIMSLFEPQEGSICMDGKDIYALGAKWTMNIGYVPQSVYLIDESVRENVAFGLREDEINDDKVWAALEQAQLADFFRKQPNGLDTIVGERGSRLSGGQRQRIAIARALYNNPEILILDEATSALDNETETAVMESIESLLGKKTMIIVAHRLSTIRNCDSIYRIEDGVARYVDKKELFD